MKKIPASYYLYAAAAIAVGVLLVAVVVGAVKSRVPSEYDAFAQCLTDQGTKMYGGWWCPHCQDQKKLFGTAFSLVDYVECSPGSSKAMSSRCRDAGVEVFPTWIFGDGTKVSGVQSFEDLSRQSTCPLSAEGDVE